MKMETKEIYVLTLDTEDRVFLMHALIFLMDAATKDNNHEVETECLLWLEELGWKRP